MAITTTSKRILQPQREPKVSYLHRLHHYWTDYDHSPSPSTLKASGSPRFPVSSRCIKVAPSPGLGLAWTPHHSHQKYYKCYATGPGAILRWGVQLAWTRLLAGWLEVGNLQERKHFLVGEHQYWHYWFGLHENRKSGSPKPHVPMPIVVSHSSSPVFLGSSTVHRSQARTLVGLHTSPEPHLLVGTCEVKLGSMASTALVTACGRDLHQDVVVQYSENLLGSKL